MKLKKLAKFEGHKTTLLMMVFNVIMSFFILKIEFLIGMIVAMLFMIFTQEKFLRPALNKIDEDAMMKSFNEGYQLGQKR